LIVFPETWLPGYPAWLDVCRDVALWDHPPVKAVFARLAENSVAGSVRTQNTRPESGPFRPARLRPTPLNCRDNPFLGPD